MTSSSLTKTQAFIDGMWTGTPTLPVINPATGEEVSRVLDLGPKDARFAIEAAHKAFPAWRTWLAKDRSSLLRRWHDLVMANADVLAELLTREQGKPLVEARNEIIYGASFIEFFAEESKRIYGELIPTHQVDARVLVLKQPLGVVSAITPWNFPNAMVTRKIAPALAAGCTVVCKPASQTPLSALALASLAEQAGFPAGVINVVTSAQSAEIGEELSTHPLVRAVAFTGSTEVGRILMKNASATVKRVSLELGGNAPFIVFDDADIDAAVSGAMISKFRNSGQTCVCANRFFVQDKVFDQFVSKLKDAVQKLKIGNGLEDGVTQGPLINQTAVEKAQNHLEDAIKKGATHVMGGKPHKLGKTYFEPTIVINTTKEMRLMQEETFGPIAPITKFNDEREMLTIANDTPFGLAGYFYARDVGRIWRTAEALECGMIGVNSGFISSEMVPFGGIKQSGIGREGSSHGIEDYVDLKYVLIGGI